VAAVTVMSPPTLKLKETSFFERRIVRPVTQFGMVNRIFVYFALFRAMACCIFILHAIVNSRINFNKKMKRYLKCVCYELKK
jgi:hypothetical protein